MNTITEDISYNHSSLTKTTTKKHKPTSTINTLYYHVKDNDKLKKGRKSFPSAFVHKLKRYPSVKLMNEIQATELVNTLIQDFIPLNINAQNVKTLQGKNPYWENKVLKEKLRQAHYRRSNVGKMKVNTMPKVGTRTFLCELNNLNSKNNQSYHFMKKII